MRVRGPREIRGRSIWERSKSLAKSIIQRVEGLVDSGGTEWVSTMATSKGGDKGPGESSKQASFVCRQEIASH